MTATGKGATAAGKGAPTPAPPDPEAGLLEWGGVAVLCLCGALAALLEALLVPLYAGSVLVPIAVVLAVASNVLLPRMARIFVPGTLPAALPFLAWLIVIVVFGVLARPEGDVILPGGSGGLQWVSYGVMLGGALAGTVAVATSTPFVPRTPANPAERPGPTSRPGPSKRPGPSTPPGGKTVSR
jgi:hypothetical protein